MCRMQSLGCARVPRFLHFTQAYVMFGFGGKEFQLFWLRACVLIRLGWRLVSGKYSLILGT